MERYWTEWAKGDTVTLKTWTIAPVRGTVSEIEADGTLIVELPGGALRWVSPDAVEPKRKA